MLKLKIWVQNPEKRGEEAVCGCQFREALEAFCLQGAQHLLREITHRGGAACSPGAAQPLTVDMGSLCHHFLPSQRAHSPQTQALPLSTDTGTRRPSGDKNTALHTCRTLPVASGLSKYLPKHLKELRRLMAYLSVQDML